MKANNKESDIKTLKSRQARIIDSVLAGRPCLDELKAWVDGFNMVLKSQNQFASGDQLLLEHLRFLFATASEASSLLSANSNIPAHKNQIGRLFTELNALFVKDKSVTLPDSLQLLHDALEEKNPLAYIRLMKIIMSDIIEIRLSTSIDEKSKQLKNRVLQHAHQSILFLIIKNSIVDFKDEHRQLIQDEGLVVSAKMLSQSLLQSLLGKKKKGVIQRRLSALSSVFDIEIFRKESDVTVETVMKRISSMSTVVEVVQYLNLSSLENIKNCVDADLQLELLRYHCSLLNFILGENEMSLSFDNAISALSPQADIIRQLKLTFLGNTEAMAILNQSVGILETQQKRINDSTPQSSVARVGALLKQSERNEQHQHDDTQICLNECDEQVKKIQDIPLLNNAFIKCRNQMSGKLLAAKVLQSGMIAPVLEKLGENFSSGVTKSVKAIDELTKHQTAALSIVAAPVSASGRMVLDELQKHQRIESAEKISLRIPTIQFVDDISHYVSIQLIQIFEKQLQWLDKTGVDVLLKSINERIMDYFEHHATEENFAVTQNILKHVLHSESTHGFMGLKSIKSKGGFKTSVEAMLTSSPLIIFSEEGAETYWGGSGIDNRLPPRRVSGDFATQLQLTQHLQRIPAKAIEKYEDYIDKTCRIANPGYDSENWVTAPLSPVSLDLNVQFSSRLNNTLNTITERTKQKVQELEQRVDQLSDKADKHEFKIETMEAENVAQQDKLNEIADIISLLQEQLSEQKKLIELQNKQLAELRRINGVSVQEQAGFSLYRIAESYGLNRQEFDEDSLLSESVTQTSEAGKEIRFNHSKINRLLMDNNLRFELDSEDKVSFIQTDQEEQPSVKRRLD